MSQDKIAILTDSGCDLTPEILSTYGIYQLPLSIICNDGNIYADGVDIDAGQLYQLLETETPTTSLPTGAQVENMLRQIQTDGYQKLLAVTISSNLSGTCNVLRLNRESCPGLEVEVVDSRNISVGGGLLALKAAQAVSGGCSWSELKLRIQDAVSQSKVFFHLKTLEYLRRGGRIGHVASILGNALNLRPIISCDPEGIYYTEAKVVGRRMGLKKLCECAERFAAGAGDIQLALMHGAAAEELAQIKEHILELLPQAKIIIEGQINPSLAVHTGPGLLGIGVLRG